MLEDTGVAAYLGQVGHIKSKKILGAAGTILPIEARHAGWIRDINGVDGAPTAFEAAKVVVRVHGRRRTDPRSCFALARWIVRPEQPE